MCHILYLSKMCAKIRPKIHVIFPPSIPPAPQTRWCLELLVCLFLLT